MSNISLGQGFVNLNSGHFLDTLRYVHKEAKIISPKEAVYRMRQLGSLISIDTFYNWLEGKCRADVDNFWFWVAATRYFKYVRDKLFGMKQLMLPFPGEEKNIPIIVDIGKTLAAIGEIKE